MKKLLTIAAIAAASTALAVESSNTFGILRVDSSAAQTIVSVPWLAAGGGDINVADVVKTANLRAGDMLYYYSGNNDASAQPKYKAWMLEVINGEKTWSPYTSVVADTNGATLVDNSVIQTIARGGAIILVRTNPESCFYLYGQYTASVASTTCVQDGYTLLAPTGLNRECDLNDANCCEFTGTIGENDMIYIPNARGVYSIYEYYEGNWGMWKKNFVVGATIPVGSGAWYVSKGGSPTITWKNPSASNAQ